MFHLIKKSNKSNARTAILKTPHGQIKTPCFMPIATTGAVKTLSAEDLKLLGAQIILSNTYHLLLRPGLPVIKKSGDLHSFMNWSSPILTDSGGFQVYSLAKIRKVTDKGVIFQSPINGQKFTLTPEKALKIQKTLGSDIAMLLDECVGYPASRDALKKAVNRTTDWAKMSKVKDNQKTTPNITGVASGKLTDLPVCRSDKLNYSIAKQNNLSSPQNVDNFVDNFKVVEVGGVEPPKRGLSDRQGKPATPTTFSLYHTQVDKKIHNLSSKALVFAINQGGIYKDLRLQSARDLTNLNFDGYALGGLAVGEPWQKALKVLNWVVPELPEEKPRYLMGVGYPEQIIQSVAHGLDMFDCVIPTREARHGKLFLWKRARSKGQKIYQLSTISNQLYHTIQIQNSRFTRNFSAINPASKIPELREYPLAYLRHLFKIKEPLAQRLATLNNLEFYLDLMSKIREGIKGGVL